MSTYKMAPLLTILSSILPNILDRILPGDNKEIQTKKLEIQSEILKGVMDQDIAQMDINKTEAASAHLFVAGWRPFAGWCSVFAVMIWPILSNLLNWILIVNKLPVIPPMDTSLYMTILMGMLGIGSLRTYEKYNEVDTKKINPILSAFKKSNPQ